MCLEDELTFDMNAKSNFITEKFVKKLRSTIEQITFYFENHENFVLKKQQIHYRISKEKLMTSVSLFRCQHLFQRLLLGSSAF